MPHGREPNTRSTHTAHRPWHERANWDAVKGMRAYSALAVHARLVLLVTAAAVRLFLERSGALWAIGGRP